jgi:hypothetical protein
VPELARDHRDVHALGPQLDGVRMPQPVCVHALVDACLYC